MTSRTSTREALGFDRPEPSGSFRYGRPGHVAGHSHPEDANLFNFDRCLEAYEQGADVSRMFDMSKFLAVTDELYATIPVPVVTVDSQPYKDVYDMVELVQRDRTLFISTLNGPAYWSPEVTTKTRAIHDWYAHIVPRANFSWEGEINAFKASLPLYPKDLHWLVYSELILQVAQLLTYQDVAQKIVYCRNGEPLRTFDAWRKLNGRGKDASAKRQYGDYVHEFVATAEVVFAVPELIESQLQ